MATPRATTNVWVADVGDVAEVVGGSGDDNITRRGPS